MTLVVVVLFIVTTSTLLFSSQVINQIKFTKRTEDSMVNRYEVDSGIEVALSELLKNINVQVKEKTIIENQASYTIKTILISYLPLLDIDSPEHFEGEKYNILIKAISDSGSSRYIELGKNETYLDSFTINYSVNVKSKENMTKDKNYNVEIKLSNVVESNKYGVSYTVTLL